MLSDITKVLGDNPTLGVKHFLTPSGNFTLGTWLS